MSDYMKKEQFQKEIRKVKNLFFKRMGYELNYENPQSYNEKVIWKQYNNTNPLLHFVDDKYLVRSYLRNFLGKEEANKILVPLFAVFTDPNIDIANLPEEYVIKSTRGSGTNRIVIKDNPVTQQELTALCVYWLRRDPAWYTRWEYMSDKEITRRIIIEKLLRDKHGNIPDDYRFYIIHGKCQLVMYNTPFQSDGVRATGFYTAAWEKLNVHRRGKKWQEASCVEKPNRWEEAVQLAEKLAEPFDMVRIDLYIFDDKIYFGEFTHNPGAGLTKFEPIEYDFELGKKWTIRKDYWRNK